MVHTFSVPHPDGTISTRNGALPGYTHAVVCHVHDPHRLADSHELEAADVTRGRWHALEAERIRRRIVEHPAGWYEVWRWTRNHPDAMHAVMGPLLEIVRPGQRLDVVPVDVPATVTAAQRH